MPGGCVCKPIEQCKTAPDDVIVVSLARFAGTALSCGTLSHGIDSDWPNAARLLPIDSGESSAGLIVFTARSI